MTPASHRLSFDEAVERGLGVGTDQIDPDAFAALLGMLRNWVIRIAPSLRDEADDIVAEAIIRVVERRRDGADIVNSAAYLTTTVRHLALGRLRQEARRAAIDVPAVQDNGDGLTFEAVVDRMVGASQVQQAFSAARTWRSPDGQSDATAVRVLSAFLDLAADRTPTVREVAAAAGVTHVTVMRVYLQVRRFLNDGTWVSRSQFKSST